MAKPILVSGIQPTGRLHLGNYLGALKNFVELQNSGKYQCYFFIADYHSLTENYGPKEKPAQILNLAMDFLAAGLNPKKSTLFLQSQIPAHTELAWIFNTLATLGELERMTQFKDKATNKESINAGLLTYPALMAADILLYDPAFVPVGEDQLQHLELTRSLSRKFNSRFGKTFTEPKEILTAVPRLMSLDDPTKKMSKSHPSGCLFIDNSPEEIQAKLKRAVTDSGSEIKYDLENKPGVSNLLTILSGLTGKSIISLESDFSGQNYSALKTAVAEEVSNYFSDFRKKKAALTTKAKEVKKVLSDGTKKATKVAAAKLSEVKEKIGLIM